MLDYYEPQLNARLHIGHLEESFPHGSRQCLPFYTVLLNFDGSCCLRSDTIQVDLDGAMAFTLSPGTLLEVADIQPESVTCIQFNREFYCVEYHDVEVSCNGLLFNAATQPPIIRVPESENAALTQLMQVLTNEFRNHDNLQLEMLRVLLKRVIITCARLVKMQLESDRSMGIEQTDLLRSFSALVDKHFRTRHKVAEYAAMLNRSPKTLSNLFLRYADRSALQVIHERIAIEAQRLLLSTDHTAKEIAFELGFSDPAQFNRFFKKMTGRTTQELRDARHAAVAGS